MAEQSGQDIDFRPLYRQIKDVVRQRIAEGYWQPGEALPSEQRLARELGVSSGTVRKALDELAAEHIISRRQGFGTFVNLHTEQHSLFHFFNLVAESGARSYPDSQTLSVDRGPAQPKEATALDLGKRAPVVRVKRLRFLDRDAVLLEWIVVPDDLFPDLARGDPTELPNALYDLFQSRYGVSVIRADEALRAVAADADDAAYLDVAEGAPLLEIERIAHDLNARRVELRISRVRTDRYVYRTSLT